MTEGNGTCGQAYSNRNRPQRGRIFFGKLRLGLMPDLSFHSLNGNVFIAASLRTRTLRTDAASVFTALAGIRFSPPSMSASRRRCGEAMM